MSICSPHGVWALRIRPLLLLLLALAAAGAPLRAGNNAWTHIGPEGGFVQSMALDPQNPNIVYAGLWNGTIYRSTSGGSSWVSIFNNAGDAGVIYQLVPDPKTPGTLYIATAHRGVMKSTDQGSRWASVLNWSDYTETRALAIDPSKPSTIYAGTGEKGVYRSLDQGGTWTAVNAGLGSMDIRSLAVDPLDSSTLYAGTADKGIYRSTDQGNSWVSQAMGSRSLRVMSIAIHPSSPGVLYAGTDNGVYRSTNRGDNWLTVNAGLESRWVEALAIDPLAPDTLYAGADSGLYRSDNRGNGWVRAGDDLLNYNIYSMALHPQTRGTLYVGTQAGIHLSRNSGSAWSPVNAGIFHTHVQALAVDPRASSTIYAGAQMGLFRSTDRAQSWLLKQKGIVVPHIHTLLFDPQNSKTIYAGTCCGLYQSKDQGDSWVSAGDGLESGEVLSMAVDPTAPATLYVGTWKAVNRSRDSGSHWSVINKGLDAGGGDLEVRGLAVDPAKPSTLYAGTVTGVYRSTDQGDSWTALNAGLDYRSVRALVLDSRNTSLIYVGTDRGIYRSTNGGSRWEAANAGLEHYFINQLILDPLKIATIYAATDGGAYRSTDGGESWYSLNYNLEEMGMSSLAVDPVDPNRLYAGLEEMGAYSIDLGSGPTTTSSTVPTTTAGTSSTSTTSLTLPSTSTTRTVPSTTTSTTATTTTTASTTTTAGASTTTTTLKPTGPAYLTFDGCGGARGGIIRLELSLSSTVSLSDIQFDYVFSSSALTFLKAEEGPQALLAGKTLTRSELQAGRWQVQIGSSGNKRIIESGVIATLQMQVAATASLGSTPVLINRAQGTSPQGAVTSLPDLQRGLEVLSVPVLDYITPSAGREGNLLVLHGSQFGGCSSSARVTFSGANGYRASVAPLEVGPQRMVVTVPSDARQNLSVTVAVSDVPARNSFDFQMDSSQPFSRLTTEMEEATSLGGQSLPAGAAIDVRSNLAYVADSFNGQVLVLDVASGRKVAEQAVLGGSPVRLALDPGQSRLIATQPQANSVALFEIQGDGKLSRTAQLAVGTSPLGVAVDSPLELAVVVNNGSRTVTLVDLRNARTKGTLPVGRDPLDVAVDPGKHRAYVINSGDNSVTEIDLAGVSVLRTINGVGTRPLSVQFHGESGSLLVGSESGLLVGDLARSHFVPLLAGEAVDSLAIHSRRGLANAVNNGKGRLTTVDIVAALGDASRSVVGAIPMPNRAVRDMSVNTLTNEGLATHSGSASLSREQADNSGVSRITLSSSLNFPRLMLNPLSDLFAVAISNPLSSAGTLQMTAINSQGQRVEASGVRNPATISLPSGGQLAKLESEPDLFGGGIQAVGSSWYKLVAQNPGLKAFFLTADSEFRRSIVGADESGVLLTEMILPAVRSNVQTALSLINPMPFAATVSLKLMADSGRQADAASLSIPAYGMLQKNLEELFPAGVPQLAGGGYVRVSSSGSLRGYQLLLPQGRLDAAGLNGQSAVSGSKVLHFSYFVAGRESGSGIDYETRIGLVNLESETRNVTLQAYGAGGALLAPPRTVTVTGSGRVEPELRELFGLPGGSLTQGWLRVEGQGRLAGYLTYATADALAAVVSLAEPRTRLTFSHVAEQGTGFFTGLALLNTHTEAVTATITVYKANGSVSATGPAMRIDPNGQRVGLLNQLVGSAVLGQSGGYVVVHSGLPIHGIEIFGTADGKALANVPGQ